MRLLQLARGPACTVLLVVGPDGTAYVDKQLTKVSKKFPKLAADAHMVLNSLVPQSGPLPADLPRGVLGERVYSSGKFNTCPGLRYFSLHLAEGETSEEPALRIPWFYGAQHLPAIVCTRAFLKRGETPQREIDRSCELLKRFKKEPVEVILR